MDDFNLDYRLNEDCIKLGYLDDNLVLMMNNSLVPWLILVPSLDSTVYEFDLLNRDQQIALLDQINQLSSFLRKQFHFDKLNIATIGNIVRQMHIHIVARSENDYCWPAVVWGAKGRQFWTDEQITRIQHQLVEFLPNNFKILHKPT